MIIHGIRQWLAVQRKHNSVVQCDQYTVLQSECAIVEDNISQEASHCEGKGEPDKQLTTRTMSVVHLYILFIQKLREGVKKILII